MYNIAPMETTDTNRRAEIDLTIESGNIIPNVVITAYKDLKRVIPPSGSPVISLGIPKLLQHITNSFVTKR